MAEMMSSGKIASESGSPDNREIFQNVLHTNKKTQEIGDTLVLFEERKEPCFVLIEGASGIGKSILLKEIAYRWGKKQLLKNFNLVLLVCLRDPSLLEIKSTNDPLKLFY